MKLFRFGELGREKPGALDTGGRMRDVSALVPDWTPEWLAPERLEALRTINLGALPLVADGVRIGAPVSGIRQFMAIGLNYRRHAEEAGMGIPTEPVVFTKAITCIAGPNDSVALPPESVETDWEVELGVIIGSRARHVDEADALAHVAGYVLANDLSERAWQLKRGGQWCKGKSFDGFGPIGPWLVTADELPDPQNVPLALAVNGQTRQQSNTSDMVFPVSTIVSYLSRFMTLLPGDLVITGTPQGVGMGMSPPVFLKRGDVMTLDGGILGKQHQEVV